MAKEIVHLVRFHRGHRFRSINTTVKPPVIEERRAAPGEIVTVTEGEYQAISKKRDVSRAKAATQSIKAGTPIAPSFDFDDVEEAENVGAASEVVSGDDPPAKKPTTRK